MEGRHSGWVNLFLFSIYTLDSFHRGKKTIERFKKWYEVWIGSGKRSEAGSIALIEVTIPIWIFIIVQKRKKSYII